MLTYLYALFSFIMLQTVLRKRDAIQMEYDLLLEELSRKKEDREQVLFFTSLLDLFSFVLLSSDQRRIYRFKESCNYYLGTVLK